MPADTPNQPIPIKLNLPREFTAADLQSAIHDAISPQFVRRLHHAHQNAKHVALMSGKTFKSTVKKHTVKKPKGGQT
jgi:hypothetical protein